MISEFVKLYQTDYRLFVKYFLCVELFDSLTNEPISYLEFGTRVTNLFLDISLRIGESVLSKDKEIFEVTDILTYKENIYCIKRFYLKKKTERNSITNV